MIAVEDGYRESEQSWWELLRDLHSRGLTMEPKLAIGDGAFWKALAKVYGNTRRQRCWVHKTGNVLILPKVFTRWMAETRYRAFDEFLTTYQLKFPRRLSMRGAIGLLRFSG